MLPSLKPMLATAGALPVDQSGWAFELKWDGIRAVSYWNGATTRFESRNQRDITVSWPELEGLGESLGVKEAVLDGEIVALDDRGVPSFQRLQERMHVASRATAVRLSQRVPAAYFVFDVLHVDGATTMSLPWAERRNVLEQLEVKGPCWVTPPAFVGEDAGDDTMAASTAGGFEGVVAKRLDSTYTPGLRSRHWLKIKLQKRDEFVVCGWTAGEGRRAGSIGSLALALPVDGGGWCYVGNVGTGFTNKELARLEALLRPRVVTDTPYTQNVRLVKKGTVFVHPEVVVDVEYTETTDEGILRHPSYKGQRIDKSPEDVKTVRPAGG